MAIEMEYITFEILIAEKNVHEFYSEFSENLPVDGSVRLKLKTYKDGGIPSRIFAAVSASFSGFLSFFNRIPEPVKEKIKVWKIELHDGRILEIDPNTSPEELEKYIRVFIDKFLKSAEIILKEGK